MKHKYRTDYKKLMKEKLNKKPMHGKFPHFMDKEYTDIEW